MVSVLAVALVSLGPGLAAEPPAGPIKVGVVLPLTGEQARFVEIKKNSFLMALEEINKSSEVNGKQIELLTEDDTGKPDIGRSAVEKLVSRDNGICLAGGYSSSVTCAICAVAQPRKTPFKALGLGCETYSNDLNPVAVLKHKCTLEYYQRRKFLRHAGSPNSLLVPRKSRPRRLLQVLPHDAELLLEQRSETLEQLCPVALSLFETFEDLCSEFVQ